MVQLKEKQSTVITSGRRSNSEQIRVPLRNFSPETIQRHVDPYVYKYLNNYCTSDVPFCSQLFSYAPRHSCPCEALTHYSCKSPESHKIHARTHSRTMHALMHATSNQNDSNPNILYSVKVLANYTLCIRKCIYMCVYIYI